MDGATWLHTSSEWRRMFKGILWRGEAAGGACLFSSLGRRKIHRHRGHSKQRHGSDQPKTTSPQHGSASSTIWSSKASREGAMALDHFPDVRERTGRLELDGKGADEPGLTRENSALVL